MTRPVRLQLSRRAGASLHALSIGTNGLTAVNVARPTKWGNPFTAEGCRDAGFEGSDAAIAARCVAAFRAWLTSPSWRINWDGPESEKARDDILQGLSSLRGKNLACWCAPGAPCHADVLLELANEGQSDD